MAKKKIIKKIKVKQQDGSLSDYIPIGTTSENVEFNGVGSTNKNLNEKIADIDKHISDINTTITNTIPAQINNAIDTRIPNNNSGKVNNAKYADSTGSATTASKLGTSNVGGQNQLIYLNGGTPTAGTQISTAATKGIKTLSAKGVIGTSTSNVPDCNAIAYWNGAYSGTSSNLTYSANGTIVGTSSTGLKPTIEKDANGWTKVTFPWYTEYFKNGKTDNITLAPGDSAWCDKNNIKLLPVDVERYDKDKMSFISSVRGGYPGFTASTGLTTNATAINVAVANVTDKSATEGVVYNFIIRVYNT